MSKAKAKTKPRTWRWVSRDIGSDFVEIWFGGKKPILGFDAEGEFACANGACVSVCVDELTATIGREIQPGECVKVNFNLTVLED